MVSAPESLAGGQASLLSICVIFAQTLSSRLYALQPPPRLVLPLGVEENQGEQEVHSEQEQGEGVDERVHDRKTRQPPRRSKRVRSCDNFATVVSPNPAHTAERAYTAGSGQGRARSKARAARRTRASS